MQLAWKTLLLLLSSIAFGQTQTSIETVGPLNWNDPPETARATLEARFGAAAYENGQIQTAGFFAGQPAQLLLQYQGAHLESIAFTVRSSGETQLAFSADQAVYSLLTELYGLPPETDLFTAERAWLFADDRKIAYRRKVNVMNGTRVSSGKAKGSGIIKGQSKRLFTNSEVYETSYTIDFTPGYEAGSGLEIESAEPFSLYEVTSFITFYNKPLSVEEPPQDAAPAQD